MNEPSKFLTDKVAAGDAVLLAVTARPRPQTLRARLLRIYSTSKCMHGHAVGDDIEFVHAPSSWGNTALQVGEQGIVFLSSISGRLYEDAWRGHMVIEEIEGIAHAIFPHLVVSTDASSPSSRAIQDPKRAYARAIALDDLERYLRELVAQT